jgi:hypothetical protein
MELNDEGLALDREFEELGARLPMAQGNFQGFAGRRRNSHAALFGQSAECAPVPLDPQDKRPAQAPKFRSRSPRQDLISLQHGDVLAEEQPGVGKVDAVHECDEMSVTQELHESFREPPQFKVVEVRAWVLADHDLGATGTQSGQTCQPLREGRTLTKATRTLAAQAGDTQGLDSP